RELAPGEERYTERGEVARTDLVVVGVAVGVRSGPEPLYGDISLPVVTSQNRHVRRRHGCHTRRCPKLLFETLEEQTSAVKRVAVQIGRQTERDNVIDVESKIHATDVQQALHKETRRGE